MKNKIFTVLMILLLSVFLVPAAVFAEDGETEQPAVGGTISATGEKGTKAIVEDNAGLFTEEQREQLLAQISELLPYGNMGIATSEESNSDAAAYARQKYIELFGETSGTLFLIDMYNRRIQIFSGADFYKTLSQVKANEITDNVYIYATEGDYYQTASSAFEQIRIVAEGGSIIAPMRYATNAAFAIGIVLLINFIIIRVQRKRSSNATKLTNALVYDTRDRGVTPVQGVRTVMTKQTKTRHTQSSGGGGGFSGGGGGFSGGGGGGGFSGGGGGHSF